MAAFQSYNKLLICESDELQNVKAGNAIIGYEFYSQYPSYRGTFLSCIEKMKIYVDGEEVSEQQVYFHINGKQCLLSQLRDLYLEYWFVLDKARIMILKNGGLATGNHEVTMKLRHKIPYTGYFGNYLVLDSSDTKQLVLEEREA